MTASRKRQGPLKTGPGQPWELLLAEVLIDRPRLEGAACTGRSELFDPAEVGEDPDQTSYRQLTARTLCQSCPVLAECRTWAGSEKLRGRVLGGLIPKSTRLTPRGEVA